MRNISSYIDNDNELPFAVVALPGTVTVTGDIVVKFNKAVDRDYGECYIHSYRNFTETWSSDKKTLTLKPTATWGTVGNSTNIWFKLYTPPASGGVRENVNWNFSVRIIE